jgi:hypothetical protein
METALSAATWLVWKVLNKLSDDLVAAYVASSELSLNADQIKEDLLYTHGLLHAAQGRGDNPGLRGLLEQLSKKADEAEDALDELHYFMIQDKLHGTQHAVPDLGSDQHGRNAVCHTIGNWYSCFCCSSTQDDADCAATAVVETSPTTINSDDGNGSDHVDKLTFDRVAMSIKIKSVIEGIHSKCIPVSDLLKIPSTAITTHTTATLKRPLKGSMVEQDKLYGRSVIFEETIKDITGGTYHGETLSVLPIVGPGGIGKTTFTQHLYNDQRTIDHFAVRVWVCVSTDFDVLKLTQQIHSCILAIEKKENNIFSAIDSLDQLQISIAHRLESKRFLIVLDDIWKCDRDDEWKTLLAPFTKGEVKGNMVLVTTRFPKIEKLVNKATVPINLQGLDHKEFFEFFKACIFGENKPVEQYSELIDIGEKIAEKLKCSPLAAKTVARLLKRNLSWEHWRKVLENSEWKIQTNSDDIMPALKISYDYLPYHLKQRFSYFGLFPEDYKFKDKEITGFWDALGINDTSDKENHLEELVDNGFLMKEVVESDDHCYVMHDLLHELSRSVSSLECTTISSLSFSANMIARSIRHLSITIENKFDENFKREMAKLKSMIDIGNLRTLMIFGEYEERIDEILKDTFNEIEGLRVLFIVMKSPTSLPKNFSKLLHLRYLKISSLYEHMDLPRSLPIFYHLLFLDLIDWHGSSDLPKSFSHLLNLRHFIAHSILHSNVPEVGKIEHLEELKEFHVKKESVGFELEELGNLSNLGGELRICNLQMVATREEASKAKLALKMNLKKLALVWRTEQSAADADVIDGLQPHDSLRELVITVHSGVVVGPNPPSWLCPDIHMTHLQSLTLEGVSWVTLPPFGHLPYLKALELRRITKVRFIGPDSGSGRNQCFMHLKDVMISDMPDLEKWTLGTTCHLFPVLGTVACFCCPSLLALPFFPDCSVSCSRSIHCPSLRSLWIIGCPELFLPVMPPAPYLTHIHVENGIWSVRLYENRLTLRNYRGAFAFHNMGNIVELDSRGGSITSWTDLQKATSLRELQISGDLGIGSMAFTSGLTSLTELELMNCENLTGVDFNLLITLVNLKKLVVYNDEDHPCSIAVDLLSEVARRTKQLPAGSFQLETLQVDSISAVLVAPICSLLAATLHRLAISYDQRVETLTEEEEKSLQLLTSLRFLGFENCPSLPSLPQGLHSLSSLRELRIEDCPEIQSLPNGGLPSSLNRIYWTPCSDELREEVTKLKGTNPELLVYCQSKTYHLFFFSRRNPLYSYYILTCET